jgi:Uma2 family endonuclease
MSRQIKPFITPEEYLALERTADYKSEYLHGEVFAMTGASRRHSLIAANISRTLGNQLVDRPCELYVSEMRVKVSASGLYTYPDVAVVCGEPKFEDGFLDTLQNPTLLIEILSKSTERYDRIAKTDYYRTLDSLAEHLLVAQEEFRIEQYTREAEGHWVLAETSSLEGVVDLRSIDCSLALIDVYRKVVLG